jgi:DNA-binding transcriptional LysR family regulator
LSVYGNYKDKEALLSYFCGFLCHLALDSVCHPEVYREEKYTGQSHLAIETSFDCALLIQDGIGPVSHDPCRHFQINKAVISAVAAIFSTISEKDVKKSYSWAEIAQEPLILLETNSTSRKFLNSRFKEKHIELNPQIEIAAHDLLLRFASIHLGTSCVIKEFSEKELKKGIVKEMPLNPMLPARSIGCAYLKSSPLSLPAQAFLELIKEK